MTRDEAETALQAFVAQLLPGTPVIFAHENGPRPDVDYVILHGVQSPRKNASRGAVDAGGNQTSYYDRDITITFYSYGHTSAILLDTIASQLDIETNIDALNAIGLAVRDIGPARDVSTLVDNRFESRDIMEVVFGMVEVVVDAPGYFTTVSWTGTTQPPQ